MTRPQSNSGLSCIAIGLVFMAVSAVGGWRFGWSLGTDQLDCWWHAVLYAGADVAAGALVIQGARMLRAPTWGVVVGGGLALVPALALVLISVLSTFGVMSGRIAVLAGQEKVEAMDVADITWLKNQTLNDKLPIGERKTFLAEQRKAAKDAKEAASKVPDKQAVGLSKAAKAFGYDVSVSSAQLALTGLSATLPMTIQFVCLGIGFFVRAGQPAGSSQDPDKPNVGSSGSVRRPSLRLVQADPQKPVAAKVSRAEFLAVVKREMARGPLGASSHQIARVTGWGQSSVWRHQQRLRSKLEAAVGRYAGNGSTFPSGAAVA